MNVAPELKGTIHRLINEWGMTDVLRAVEEVATASLSELQENTDDEENAEYAKAYEPIVTKITEARLTAEFTI